MSGLCKDKQAKVMLCIFLWQQSAQSGQTAIKNTSSHVDRLFPITILNKVKQTVCVPITLVIDQNTQAWDARLSKIQHFKGLIKQRSMYHLFCISLDCKRKPEWL